MAIEKPPHRGPTRRRSLRNRSSPYRGRDRRHGSRSGRYQSPRYHRTEREQLDYEMDLLNAQREGREEEFKAEARAALRKKARDDLDMELEDYFAKKGKKEKPEKEVSASQQPREVERLEGEPDAVKSHKGHSSSNRPAEVEKVAPEPRVLKERPEARKEQPKVHARDSKKRNRETELDRELEEYFAKKKPGLEGEEDVYEEAEE